MSEITYIDLFAGGGGLSEGFQRAGFNPVAHVEAIEDACLTLKTRMGYYYNLENNSLNIYEDYLKGKITREEYYSSFGNEGGKKVINLEISAENIKKIFKIIDDNLEGNSLDLIVGGPPCQAYSVIGRSRIGKEKIKSDPRLNLYKQYNKFLKRYRPKALVFENVRGLLSIDGGKFFNRINGAFSRNNYYVKTFEVNSKDFGVLQDRKRLIIIGLRKDLYEKEELDFLDLSKEGVKRAKVKAILNDLPKIKPGDSLNIAKYSSYYVNRYLKESLIRNGVNFTTQHVARPHNERDLQIYRIAINEWNKYQRRLRYSDLPEHLVTHKNVSGFRDRFKVVAGDLDTSQTVVAHIAKDGHYFIHPDIDQCRSISIREAARIQSFPDNYFFEGSRTSVFKQIGNAVPPLMAFQIAGALKDLL